MSASAPLDIQTLDDGECVAVHGDVTLHTGPKMQAHVLLPVIPAKKK